MGIRETPRLLDTKPLWFYTETLILHLHVCVVETFSETRLFYLQWQNELSMAYILVSVDLYYHYHLCVM
jgi:hypothetical protein